MSARTLRISAIGFDKGETTFIRTTVELASGIEIGSWDYVDDGSAADVLLLNLDSESGRAAQQQYKGEGTGRPYPVSCGESYSNQAGAQASLPRVPLAE